MAFDFPSSPSVGAIYTSPTGVAYTWDGEKWGSGSGYGNIYIADSAPLAPVGSLWWESDTGLLYVKYNDGSSTQWVVIAGSGADAVRYGGPQTLTAAQQTQARQNIFAAPLDAMSYSGMQINGSMEVDQANNGAAVAFPAGAGFAYLADGYCLNKSGTNAFTVQQAASVFPGYNNALKLTIMTAQTSVGSDGIQLQHRIEGYRFIRMGWGTVAAQPTTINFWFKSSVGGSLSIGINDGGSNTVSTLVTITAANTVQFASVVLAPPATWTGSKTNAIGANVLINLLHAGMNIAATVGNTFEIAGLVVLPGVEAPSAARSPLIMRPYDQELVTCRRYYQIAYNGTLRWYVSNVVRDTRMFVPEMRAVPTLIKSSTGNIGLQTDNTGTGSTLYYTIDLSFTGSGIGVIDFSNYKLIADARL